MFKSIFNFYFSYATVCLLGLYIINTQEFKATQLLLLQQLIDRITRIFNYIYFITLLIIYQLVSLIHFILSSSSQILFKFDQTRLCFEISFLP